MALYNSGTFRVDQLAAFTGFSSITLSNDTSGTSVLYLGNQAVSVTELGSGSDTVHLGSGATTVHGIYNASLPYNAPYNYVYSDSSAAWNAGNAIDSINTLYLNPNGSSGANYDLTTNTLTNIGTVYGYGFNGSLTVKINSATAAGVSNFNFNGPNGGQLVTADATLDLSQTTAVGASRSPAPMRAAPPFTVKDSALPCRLPAVPARTPSSPSASTFTAAQRDAIFHTASIETIVDTSGTYTSRRSTTPINSRRATTRLSARAATTRSMRPRRRSTRATA